MDNIARIVKYIEVLGNSELMNKFVEAWFREVDTDENGVIDAKEFTLFFFKFFEIKPLQVIDIDILAKMFFAFDLNGNGVIERDELKHGIAVILKSRIENYMKEHNIKSFTVSKF